MSVEIERKFLAKNASWREQVSSQQHITQGYIKTAEVTVRIRCYRDDHSAVITIKGKREGISRLEFEYGIPYLDACDMQSKLCQAELVEKTRHIVYHQGFKWEVDEFHGHNTGLVVAELELLSETTEFPSPDWLGKEVSFESRYRNSRLITQPFADWSDRKAIEKYSKKGL